MKKLKIIALAVASLLVFANSTHAQALNAGYSTSAKEPLKVKYLGEEGKYLLFEVALQADSSSNALFAIDDKNEGELYSSGLETTGSVRTIKIENRYDLVLNFKLFLGQEIYSNSFSFEKKRVSETDITRL